MPTPDPPTPTHEEMLRIVRVALGPATSPRALRYIASAESTAAELLKARARIADLERLLESAREQIAMRGDSEVKRRLDDLSCSTLDAVAPLVMRQKERIAELERALAAMVRSAEERGVL